MKFNTISMSPDVGNFCNFWSYFGGCTPREILNLAQFSAKNFPSENNFRRQLNYGFGERFRRILSGNWTFIRAIEFSTSTPPGSESQRAFRPMFNLNALWLKSCKHHKAMFILPILSLWFFFLFYLSLMNQHSTISFEASVSPSD